MAMRTRFVRDTVARRRRRSPAAARCTPGTTCSTRSPATIGVKTGHTERRRLVPGRGRPRRRRDGLRDAPRQPDSRAQRNDDLAVAAGLGPRPSSASSTPCSPGASTRRSPLAYGKAPLALVAARPLLAVARIGAPLTERVVAAVGVSLPVRRGAVLGRVEIWAGPALVGRCATSSRRAPLTRPGVGGRLGWYAGRTCTTSSHLL